MKKLSFFLCNLLHAIFPFVVKKELREAKKCILLSFQIVKENEENEVKDPIAAVLAEASLPPYTCNIYEGLMVFTINVRNVKVDSLQKAILKDEKG